MFSPLVASSQPRSAFGQRVIASQRTKIEEDIGRQQRLRRRLAHPAGEAPAPLFDGQATIGIAGHDVAGAQRETQLGQALVRCTGKPQQPLARDRHVALGAIEDDRVVLVGRDRLFATAFAADREPAPCHVVELEFRQQQFEQSLRERIVERRNRMSQRLRGRALRDEVVRQRRNVGHDALQSCHVARLPHRLG